MTLRALSRRVPAVATSEGAGVTVHRTLGTPQLRHLDPFLMLDHFSSDNPHDYIAGFPDHPHRGFVTLTYMLDGHMRHADSMGNRGDLRAGGIQWMKAASGVIHSEMPEQVDGLMRGFQLWINLPAREKMSEPEYQEYPAARIPEVQEEGLRVRVIAGEYRGQRGPIADPNTELHYLDVRLAPGTRFRHALVPAHATFAYLYEGEADVAGEPLFSHVLAVWGEGDAIELMAGTKGARFILVAGRPINEPIVQYGPFVMNTEAEVRQAFDDYRRGRLVQTAPVMRSS